MCRLVNDDQPYLMDIGGSAGLDPYSTRSTTRRTSQPNGTIDEFGR